MIGVLFHPVAVIQSFSMMPLDRMSFLQTTITIATSSIDGRNNNNALDVLLTQRIALDNIAMVITNGNLEEAQFKSKQLIDQTRLAGTTLFQEASNNNNKSINSSILQLRLLPKFATVMDLCNEIETSLKLALLTSSSSTTTAAMTPYQLKCLRVVKDTQNAYDDLLFNIQYLKE